MKRTITIEVRADLDDQKYRIAQKSAAKLARQLAASMSLLTDRKSPEIAVFGNDFHKGKIEIDLLADE